jgi:TRAP-type uncharacterized transport system substrate-binding protein
MRSYVRESLLLIAAVVLLSLGAYMLRGPIVSRTVSLKLTAGDAAGLRHRLAIDLARQSASLGIQIDVQPTDGSEAALDALERGEVDIALVQGGLANQRSTRIRQISALHIEPLHLVVDSELFRAIGQDGLGALAGHSIGVGSPQSGTYALSNEVLVFAGLRPDSLAEVGAKSETDRPTYTPNTMSYSELLAADRRELPDALFAVSSLPSPLVSYLIQQHDFRLVELAFGEALALQALTELGDSPAVGSIDKRLIFRTTIPNHTYSVRLAEPPDPLVTLGTRMLLVAHEKVEQAAVQRLLDALYDSSFAQAERPPLEPSLLDLPPEFPLHIGAQAYRQRNKPIIAGDAVDYAEKVLAIAATVAGGVFFLLQWSWRRVRQRRKASLAAYIERVLLIEQELLENEVAARLDLSELIRLQEELAKIKSQAVSKFANGELEGEALIQGLLSLVNDTRNQLTRLILHQRENIEEQSTIEHRSSDELWKQQAQAREKTDP